MSLPTTLAHSDAIGALRAAVSGRVSTPDDADYDVARTVASGFGDTASVGIGGLTLGGGIGLLTRKYGMTIDNVLAAEVVTADGGIRQVDADHHPDLFWAIRGGGGNVGVVTKLQLQLVEVDEVYGGWLVLPATAETVAGFVATAAQAPAELTAIAEVMIAPPLPFLPPECHGLPVVLAALCHVGSADDGERAVAPLRALASPIADMVGPMRYRDLLFADELPPHRMAVRTVFLDGVDLETAAGIVTRLEASTAMMSTVQLRVLGGAMARVPADATAFAHRDRRILAMAGAMYGDPAEAAAHETWVAATIDALADGTTGAYVSFLGEGEEHRTREAYPGPTWDRLRAIKTRYDHTNLFRWNQNVPPAAETGP